MNSGEAQIRRQITELLALLKKERKLTQDAVVELTGKVGRKISSSILSRAKNKTNSKQVLSTNRLLVVLEALEKVKTYVEDVQGVSSVKKLNDFFDTKWWLYFFVDDTSNKSDSYGIGRTCLYIKKSGEVFLKNLNISGRTDYIGTVSLPAPEYLLFSLQTKNTGEKSLNMRIIIGRGDIYPINMGMYSNITSVGKVVSGSVMLQRFTGDSKEFKPFFFKNNSADYEQLEPNIRKYFSCKWQNYLKATNGISTLEDLRGFHNRNSKKSHVKFFHSFDFRYEVFIGAPMTSVSPEVYAELRSHILEIITILKSLGVKHIYYAGENLENQSSFKAPDVVYKNNFEALRESKNVLFIYPKNLVSTSSVLLEVGWALSLEKRSIMFIQERKNLPSMLHNKLPLNFSIYTFSGYDKIKQLLSNNIRSWFK